MSQSRSRLQRNHSWTSDNDTNILHCRLIGCGGFAEVHEVHANYTSLMYRCSTILKYFARKIIRPLRYDITEEDIDQEVGVIAQICTTGHGNIVQILRHDWFTSGSDYFIDMELCDLNLHDYIYRRSESMHHASALSNKPAFVAENVSTDLKLLNIWTIMDHVAHGLEFIHGRNYIHRDLKPMNVLYSRHGKLWKIADFGLAAEGTSKRAITTKYSRGTEGYRAPELLSDHPKFTNKVDIWALGCILYELAAREKAFHNDLRVRDFSISQSALPVSIPSFPKSSVMHISECISEMLGKDPLNRPPISAICVLLGQKLELMLHLAAGHGNSDVVALLLSHGADIAAKDDDGYTALHRAAMNGHADVVALLLSKMDQADVAAKDGWQNTALHWAAYYGHADVVALLQEWERDHEERRE